MRILLDGPNLVWRALSAGKDPEGIKAKDPETGKDVLINTAGYGFENLLQMLSSALIRYQAAPKDLIFVMEGRNSGAFRQRKTQNLFEYKGKRGKRPLRAYAEYSECVRQLQEFFLELGSAFCVQEEAEADDVLAYLALHAEEPVLVFTHDGDLTRLVGANPKGAMVSVGNNDWLNQNPFGPFPNEFITVYKALVGDTSDNIPGAKGFGDKSFLAFLANYGVDGLAEVERLLIARRLPELNENAETDKSIARILAHEPVVYASYDAALLYPQIVDQAKPLQWTYGMVRDASTMDDSRFSKWYGTRTLVHAGNYTKVIKEAKAKVRDYVALDLETTTSDESDEWMARRANKDEERSGVDVLGSEIVSCGLTFGDNNQHTLYLTHRHLEEEGIRQLTLEQLGGAIQYLTKGKRVLAHNAGGFELPVLRNHFAFEGDEEGFLPDVHCTKILASYANENVSSGLKPSARHYLRYDQQTYQEVTGGKKMDQITATHTLRYGTDDTIVTAALYNHLSFLCQSEDTWKAYCEVEQAPMYLQAAAFLEGVPISLERMKELEREDDRTWDESWALLRSYLIEKGWEGTTPPEYTPEITAAQIKEAYAIVTGNAFVTQVRTPMKLAKLIEAEGHENFADFLVRCIEGEPKHLTQYVQAHFSGEPQLNMNSPKQLAALLYETMALPIRLRNKLTDKMVEKGQFEGNPQTDEEAIEYALHFDKGGERPDVLRAILALKTVETRRKMYYKPYQFVEHWKDRLVHASFNQCATVTRRYTCSGPNLQQLPKKDEGLKFREVILPHKPRGAVVVSMDFAGQELRLMAEESQDPVMLDCYIGDDLKDMHSLTGAAISEHVLEKEVSYEALMAGVRLKEGWAKELRALGKKINFTVQYGAMAPKVALTLLIELELAERILAARAELFKVSEQWKEEYIAKVRDLGYATTRLGARRHLRAAFDADFRTASKAERQGPNFKIQGSGAEMTKLAMRRMWERKIFTRFDARPYGPVHDEYVASCSVADLVPFIQEMHACMVEPYADMKVPIVSSISFGPTFGEQHEIGEEPEEEAILLGLKEIGMEIRQAA